MIPKTLLCIIKPPGETFVAPPNSRGSDVRHHLCIELGILKWVHKHHFGKQGAKGFFFFYLWWILSYIEMKQPWVYMCSPSQSPFPSPSPSHPSGSSQCTSPEHLSHASNLGWWSVSPLIIYMFQCCSLKTSHPRLLPQSPKVCYIHLCLFFCFVYRVIVTIFLNSIYMC